MWPVLSASALITGGRCTCPGRAPPPAAIAAYIVPGLAPANSSPWAKVSAGKGSACCKASTVGCHQSCVSGCVLHRVASCWSSSPAAANSKGTYTSELVRARSGPARGGHPAKRPGCRCSAAVGACSGHAGRGSPASAAGAGGGGGAATADSGSGMAAQPSQSQSPCHLHDSPVALAARATHSIGPGRPQGHCGGLAPCGGETSLPRGATSQARHSQLPASPLGPRECRHRRGRKCRGQTAMACGAGPPGCSKGSPA